jgi:hypothetical protein
MKEDCAPSIPSKDRAGPKSGRCAGIEKGPAFQPTPMQIFERYLLRRAMKAAERIIGPDYLAATVA